MKFQIFVRKLHWLDYVILAVILAFLFAIWYRIEGNLNYKWQWGRIPNYIIRWNEEETRWVTNLLVQGLVTTIRISIYASVLALIFGTILGIAELLGMVKIIKLSATG